MITRRRRRNSCLTPPERSTIWRGYWRRRHPRRAGDPVRAIGLAQRACALTGNQEATCVDTLAIAYAAAGRFDEAVGTAQRAVELARTAEDPQLVGEIETRLELYRSGHAYHPSDDGTSVRKP
ncbi:MAG TPA: hypothetical protein VL486_11880 [Verrucomicrobiae bacterium]|nr:hypothetical protein [Verrucomicrobiae bacterium]